MPAQRLMQKACLVQKMARSLEGGMLKNERQHRGRLRGHYEWQSLRCNVYAAIGSNAGKRNCHKGFAKRCARYPKDYGHKQQRCCPKSEAHQKLCQKSKDVSGQIRAKSGQGSGQIRARQGQISGQIKNRSKMRHGPWPRHGRKSPGSSRSKADAMSRLSGL